MKHPRSLFQGEMLREGKIYRFNPFANALLSLLPFNQWVFRYDTFYVNPQRPTLNYAKQD